MENGDKFTQIFPTSSPLPTDSCNFLPTIFTSLSSLIFEGVLDGKVFYFVV